MNKQLSPVKTIQKELKHAGNKIDVGFFGAAKFWKPFGKGSHFFRKATREETLQYLKNKTDTNEFVINQAEVDRGISKTIVNNCKSAAADTHHVLAKHAESRTSAVKTFHYAKAAVYADGVDCELAAKCAFEALELMRQNGSPAISINADKYRPYMINADGYAPYISRVELTVIAVKNYLKVAEQKSSVLEYQRNELKLMEGGPEELADLKNAVLNNRNMAAATQNRMLGGLVVELEELGQKPENYKKIAAVHGQMAQVLLYGRSNDELRKDLHSNDRAKRETTSEELRNAAYHFYMQSRLNSLSSLHEEAFNAACRSRDCKLLMGESDHAALEMANLRDSFYEQGGRSIESPLYKYCQECNASIDRILSVLRHEAASTKILNGKKAEPCSQISNILRCDRETSSSEQHAFALIDESHAQENVSNFNGAARTSKEALDILMWRMTNKHSITKSFESLNDTIVMLNERVENMKQRA